MWVGVCERERFCKCMTERDTFCERDFVCVCHREKERDIFCLERYFCVFVREFVFVYDKEMEIVCV